MLGSTANIDTAQPFVDTQAEQAEAPQPGGFFGNLTVPTPEQVAQAIGQPVMIIGDAAAGQLLAHLDGQLTKAQGKIDLLCTALFALLEQNGGPITVPHCSQIDGVHAVLNIHNDEETKSWVISAKIESEQAVPNVHD